MEDSKELARQINFLIYSSPMAEIVYEKADHKKENMGLTT